MQRLRDVLDRLRALPPRIADTSLAVGLAVLAIAELATSPEGHLAGARGVGIAVVTLGVTLPVTWRRRHPSRAMEVSGSAAIVVAVMAWPMAFAAAFGLLTVMYSIASHGRPEDARISGWITAVVVTFVSLRFWGEAGLSGAVSNVMLFGAAWVLGYAARNRRLLLEELRSRADLAERTRSAEAARAVAAERARIARELHDVVSHTVGVVAVQAGAARHLVTRSPEQAATALRSIEDTARSALRELRGMLVVLRPGERDASGELRAPQPDLAMLDELARSYREAGIDLDLEVDPDLAALPSGVQLSAFRVVQESLTNVLKHAGPDASATVRLRHTDGVLRVEVVDDGRGAAADRGGGPRAADPRRHGLIGMRERVGLYGGALEAGPRPGGGFRVTARIPVTAGSDRAAHAAEGAA